MPEADEGSVIRSGAADPANRIAPTALRRQYLPSPYLAVRQRPFDDHALNEPPARAAHRLEEVQAHAFESFAAPHRIQSTARWGGRASRPPAPGILPGAVSRSEQTVQPAVHVSEGHSLATQSILIGGMILAC